MPAWAARDPAAFKAGSYCQSQREECGLWVKRLNTFPLSCESHLYLLLYSSDFLVLSQSDKVVLASALWTGKLQPERLLQTRAAETSGRSGRPNTGVTRIVFFSTSRCHCKLMSRCLVWGEQGQYVTSAQLPASLSPQQRDPELLQLCSHLTRYHQWGWGRSCSWSCSPIPEPSRQRSVWHLSLSRCGLLEASCTHCSAGCGPQWPLCNLSPVCNMSHQYVVALVRGVRQRTNGWLKAICQCNVFKKK